MTTEELYSKFLHLYKQLAEERSVIARQGEILNEMIKSLAEEIKLTKEFKAQVRQEIVEETQKAIKNAVTNEIEETVKDLRLAVIESRESFRNYASINTNWGMALVVGAFIAAIVVGIFVGRSSSERTDREMELYSNGLRFEQFWDSIDKKERDHLNALAENHIPPEKNSLRGILARNPKMSDSELNSRFHGESKFKGDDLPPIDFGSLKTKKRAVRDGVNPKTGTKIKIPVRKAPHFPSSKKPKEVAPYF